jgi:dTDP-4-dehydrorhamnose 3,5-epimerase
MHIIVEIKETEIPDLYILEPKIFEDPRGYFYESYNEKTLKQHGLDMHFVQDNQSKSVYGVIRGLHYQIEPYAQTKLVRVLQGTVLDVVVDIRKGSPTYGEVFSLELSGENKLQLLIPKGFAHGFSVLSETAIVFYKCDEFYNKESERGIFFNDSDLSIDWKVALDKAMVSEKDRVLLPFDRAENNFSYKT